MAFAPASENKKLGMFAASRPDFKDFSGPPDGDYVRYIDKLMAWSLQEQERLRLQALGNNAHSQAGSQWGRSETGQQPAVANPMSQPGGVGSAMHRLQRKAQQMRVQPAATTVQTVSIRWPRKARWLAAIAAVVTIAYLAPPLLPFAIVAAVVGAVILPALKASRGE